MLINCPECKKEISGTAKACPSCGHRIPNSDAFYLGLKILGVLFIIWILIVST